MFGVTNHTPEMHITAPPFTVLTLHMLALKSDCPQRRKPPPKTKWLLFDNLSFHCQSQYSQSKTDLTVTHDKDFCADEFLEEKTMARKLTSNRVTQILSTWIQLALTINTEFILSFVTPYTIWHGLLVIPICSKGVNLPTKTKALDMIYLQNDTL